MIEKGTFSIPAAQGLPPGTYTVSISATPPAATETDPNKAMEQARARPAELVPAKYNVKSELTAEVKSGGAAHFDYELRTR